MYGKMIYSYNVVNGYKNINFALLGGAALLNIIINLILIPKYGILGAGMASTVSYMLCGISFLLYFTKKTGVQLKEMIIINRNDVYLLKSLFKDKNKEQKRCQKY